ncbi:hypothetical protein HK103_005730 [Boothiomyces macroporosus]|uniref:HMG box domain-containing protein n=1 Tax=Boothiomyces macroporosus TaxID=261099 RepID=A0AAD5UEI8_9FUNG|nr:hypothetical protein HK103_005730 [Boothiomyces macroporosus]
MHLQIKMGKKIHDPNPKPLNAFLRFRQEYWQSVKHIKGQRNMTQLSFDTAEKWKNMTKNERKPYEEAAYKELRLYHILNCNLNSVSRRSLKKYKLSIPEIINERIKLGIPVSIPSNLLSSSKGRSIAMKPEPLSSSDATYSEISQPTSNDIDDAYFLSLFPANDNQSSNEFTDLKSSSSYSQFLDQWNNIESQIPMNPLGRQVHESFTELDQLFLFPTYFGNAPENSFDSLPEQTRLRSEFDIQKDDTTFLGTITQQQSFSTMNELGLGESIETLSSEKEVGLVQQSKTLESPNRKKQRSQLQITVPDDKDLGRLSTSFAKLSAGFDFSSFKTGWTPASASMSFFKSMF